MYNAIIVLIIYFIGTNLTGFFLMGIDKRKAIKGAFRIPEATLFIVALIGGSAGSIAGMYVFHHKTRHPAFVYGMPAILILQAVLVIAVLNAPIEFLTI